MPLGDVFRLRSWTHVEPHMSIGFKVDDKKQVGVFMILGHEPKDGSAQLDLEKAMNDLGWFREGEPRHEGHPKPSEQSTPRDSKSATAARASRSSLGSTR